MRIALEEMGHPQPKTPVITDNTTAQGLVTNTMTSKRSKSYGMRFNFFKCREAQQQFDLVWRPGGINRADFHSKNHPAWHYVDKRGDYVEN